VSLDKVEGVLSRHGVERDAGKEGHRVKGGLGPYGPATSWGPNKTGRAGIARRA